MTNNTERKPRPKGPKRPRKPKVDPFSIGELEITDYKDVKMLRRFVSDSGKILPRRRTGLSAKHQRRMPGFDDHVISMYARGISVREIQAHLLELYGTEVSPDLISTITDEVIDEVMQWQQRPLEAMYPIVYFDALRLKIRDEGTVKNKAVYLALGIRADGRKEVLGLWIEQTEGAKFWLRVMTELKNRGVADVLPQRAVPVRLASR